MRWPGELARRFGMLVRRRQFDADLEEEMRLHLELRAQEHAEAGMNADEAREAARRQFGNSLALREISHQAWGWGWLDDVAQDATYGLRMLRKSPGFTSIAILALALGIGFSSTVFSIFYNGVLHPFPYRDANRLAVIGIYDTQQQRRYREMYHLNEIAAFRNASQAFEDVVAYSMWEPIYVHENTSEQLHGCLLTPNAIEFWGVPPLLGRGIGEQDARHGASPVVLLSYAFWKTRFSGDKSAIGAQMTLNRQRRTIIGVMPPRFLLFGADVYAPIAWGRPEPASFAQAMDNDDAMYFFATGRVRRGVSQQAAAASLQVIAKQLVKTAYPRDYPEHFQMTAKPMNEVIVDDFKQTVALLIAAVVLLLFISSSNVASLLLTHHTARSREIALRTALGATRRRLIGQLLVESLLLGFAGCLTGCFLAYFGLGLVHLVPGLSVPGEADMSLNMPVLFFAVGLSLLTTLLFGLSPALLAVKRDLRAHLQSSGTNVNASTGGTRLRGVLVVGQVALSMLLLVFAGLMMRSFLAVASFDPGMSTQGVLSADIHFPARQYESVEEKRAFLEQVLSRVETLPGATKAGIGIGLPPMPPFGGPQSDDVTVPGKPHEKHWTTDFDAVSETYFSTVGLHLLRGRLLSAADVSGARRVAVVSSSLVKSFFGNDDPLGRQIKFNVLDQMPEAPHDAYFEIVGVVSDLKGFDPRAPLLPQAYIPYTFTALGDRSILVRSVTDPLMLVNPMRQIISTIDSNVVLTEPQTLNELLEKYVYAKPEFRMISFGTCAGIGLALALIGLFGVLSYSVTLQTHELGVRMALGALPGNILSLILRQGLSLVGGGILLGLALSFFSVRILQSQLWGVSAFDLRTLFLAPLAFLCVALLACYLPARRATHVDPMIALRCE